VGRSAGAVVGAPGSATRLKVLFQSLAEHDIAAAAEHYEAARTGLGAQYLADIEAAVSLLKRQRYLGQAIAGYADYRQLLLKRFPYRLIYRLSADALVVIAVAHQRRRFGHWDDRVQEIAAVYVIAA